MNDSENVSATLSSVYRKEHEWIEEEVNGGPVGCEDFWKCKVCGASGGGVFNFRTGGKTTPSHPFLADGSGLKLTMDCDESASLIAEHKKTWVPPELRPKPTVEPGIYRHFKGKDYEVLGVAKNANGVGDFVVYREVGSVQLWVRPVGIFTGLVKGGESRFVLTKRIIRHPYPLTGDEHG